ncbi:hypothetical protein EPUS_02067 [Endocarpon pusillum Z07020]|uniref:Aminoglycoside phosphotransferase domain-containing protein n=1 Tax=Endocarpon pusillum (strain Z07020 / HMAS-L-300199) TaxID=1263415 RepID=U1HUQ0_ENDPU|nr:uncharacterized protein EPUS_02067 [Endocarpon pusillum Z07020]ERF74380.1 hypothetical protein EPUS_02067 [Endocarpon pusillum Z07020]
MGDQKAQQAGHARANELLLLQLTSRIKANPSVDLSDILAQQTSSYPKLRRSLAGQEQTQGAGERAAPPAPQPQSAYQLEASGTPQIIHPIHPLLSQRLKLPIEAGAWLHPTQNFSKESIAILNKAIRNGTPLGSAGGTPVVNLGSSIVVKFGRSLSTDQIKVLQWIKAQDSRFPVPDALGALETTDRTYLFMTLAEGVPLEKVWQDLSVLQKTSIRSQLNRIFERLRLFSHPQHSPLGSLSSRCTDMRRSERTSSVTISSEADFNDFLCSHPQRARSRWIKLIRNSMRDDHRIVMTHGDLHPKNIMVTWDGCTASGPQSHVPNAEIRIQITSLLDWEFSGWYPQYWEFVKALNTIGRRDPMSDWIEYLPPSIGVWMVEYALDSQISRWLGE